MSIDVNKKFLFLYCNIEQGIPKEYLDKCFEKLEKRFIKAWFEIIITQELDHNYIEKFKITIPYKTETEILRKTGEISAAIAGEWGGTFEGSICDFTIISIVKREESPL